MQQRATDGTGQGGHTTPRHVWVNIPIPDARQCPGIIVDWRQARGRWEALVTYAEGGGDVPARAVTGWVPAEHVELRDGPQG